MNSDAIIRRSRCLFDVLFSFLLNLFLEVEFQSEYCYSFNAVVNLHNVFSNSHTDPHSHQQFSSNGFCWVCVVSLGIRTHSLWDPPFSASQVLGWQVCLSTACHCSYLTTILWVKVMSPCGLGYHWVIIPHFVHGPNAHLSIFLYGIKGSSPCFPTLDLLLTDPLSQAWHTWSPQTFPSPVSFFPNCYFVIQMGMVVFLLPEQFAE